MYMSEAAGFITTQTIDEHSVVIVEVMLIWNRDQYVVERMESGITFAIWDDADGLQVIQEEDFNDEVDTLVNYYTIFSSW